jgi:polar amino acid transport system permease protein
MQLFLAFFGVALFGIDVSPWTAASLALTFYTSAFLLDIWFGSIRALPKGQWEASRCLGLSFGQTLFRVVAPQALRIAIAPTVGFAVQVIKGTAGIDYRLCRADQGRDDADQRHLSAV